MPADSTTAPGAVFDHEAQPRRRRAPAPDWGGDDLFDHVPRRRFQGSDAPPRRRDTSDARRHETAEHRPAARRHAGAHATRRAPSTNTSPAPAPATRPAPVEELVQARNAEYAPRPVTDPATGRRTVTVTGRPGPAFAPRTSGPARRREPRTVEERIGARPDQVAAWAFALGVLLILIALVV
ncbi:MAG TPA: hypothetical protein VF533_23065 [Solirubrobacteraceae bacterium]|jgi:hypothetical protein